MTTISGSSASLDCRKGVRFNTTGGSQVTHIGLAWAKTEEGEALEKSALVALREANELPEPEDTLLVRIKPTGDPWNLSLTIQHTSRPPVTKTFPFKPDPEKLNEDGYFSAAFVFAKGKETLPADFGFPMVHVVDVSEENELGHAPVVDFYTTDPEDKTPIKLGDAGPPKKQLLKCVCIPGVTFDFDQSFLKPSVLDHMSEVDAALTEHPDARLFILGHTDRVGNDVYNKKLSDRRAYSTFCFITDDAHGWELLYQEEKWGLRVVQTILTDLGHDPGAIDGLIGPNTRGAMNSFLGQPAGTPVENDAVFREKLFLAYMTGKHDVKATEDQFMAPRFSGCGEFNPVAPPNAAELANAAPGNEPNRRVVIYLLTEDMAAPCAVDDVAPCKAEIAKGGSCFDCAFYDSLASMCECECNELPPGKKPVPPPPPPPPGKEIPPGGKAELAVKVIRADTKAGLPGAQVALLKLPEKKPSGAYNTGPNGSVFGLKLDTGRYSVQVTSPPGWTKESTQVVLEDGDDERITIVVYRQGAPTRKATIRVVVTDITGGGSVKRAGVPVSISRWQDGFSLTKTTDGAGSVSFDVRAYPIEGTSYVVDARPQDTMNKGTKRWQGSSASVHVVPIDDKTVPLTIKVNDEGTVHVEGHGEGIGSAVIGLLNTDAKAGRDQAEANARRSANKRLDENIAKEQARIYAENPGTKVTLKIRRGPVSSSVDKAEVVQKPSGKDRNTVWEYTASATATATIDFKIER